MISKISKTLFYLVVLLLPINLGYHFVFLSSYVNGLLIDYLIPTLYVQDILVFLIIAFWFIDLFKQNIVVYDFGWVVRLLFVFIFTIFLSVLGSINQVSSIFAFLRLILYALFAVYIGYNFRIKSDLKYFGAFTLISVFFLEIIAFGQWFSQGSVFDNYIFFGEQPYNYSTYGIIKESLFDKTVIPVYGLFRHPNVFGGFLSIVLPWILHLITRFKHRSTVIFSSVAFLLGIFVLFLTFSQVAYMTFLFGISYYAVIRYEKKKHLAKWFFLIFIALGIFSFTFPTLDSKVLSINTSFSKRAQLFEESLFKIRQRPFFGVGYSASTSVKSNVFARVQPVHNIFMLILEEAGLFALFFFVIFIIFILYHQPKNSFIFISILQILMLGFFDHYIFTMHQTLLLFFIIIGFYISSLQHRG